MKSRAKSVVHFFVFSIMTLACLGNPLGEAEKLLEQGRYEDSISKYRDYYLENPHSELASKALFEIGNVYRLHLKDFKKSLEAFKVLTMRFADSQPGRDAQLLVGRMYADQFQDYQQAVIEFQKVVDGKGFSDLQRSQALLRTGNAYFSLGNFAQARIEYERLNKDYSAVFDSKVAKLQIANSFNAQGQCDKAIPIYKEVAGLGDDQGATLAVQGTFGAAACLEETGNYEEALTLFESVLDSYPSRRVVEVRMEKLKIRMREVSQ